MSPVSSKCTKQLFKQALFLVIPKSQLEMFLNLEKALFNCLGIAILNCYKSLQHKTKIL